MRSVKTSSATRSLLRTADIASDAATSATISLLNRPRVPKRCEPERSTISSTLSSRSSTYFFTNTLAGAGGDVPVDGAHVVAREVLAHLHELDPLPLEHRVVLAAEARGHQPARAQLDAPHQLEHLRQRRRGGRARGASARGGGGGRAVHGGSLP
jgi:hypothetical protein